MNPQLLQVYLFLLKVLNSLGTSAQSIVDALNELGAAVTSKDWGRVADAVAAFVKSLVPVINQFEGKAAAHFAVHAAMTEAELTAHVETAEKEFHGLFGGGGGTTGKPGGGLLGGLLGNGNLLKLLPTILSILQLFGVKLPTIPGLPTA